jgi:hypothetical protein
MSESLISHFKELRGLPVMVSHSRIYEGKEYIAKTFVNGHQVKEGESIEPFLVGTKDKAIKQTKRCVKHILAENPQVLVRVDPELSEHNGKYFVYMRLAF